MIFVLVQRATIHADIERQINDDNRILVYNLSGLADARMFQVLCIPMFVIEIRRYVLYDNAYYKRYQIQPSKVSTCIWGGIIFPYLFYCIK